MLTRTVHFAVALAVLGLLAIGASSYRAIVQVSTSEQAVRHTHEVLTTLQALRFSIKSVESNGRGFILTANESFLTAFHATSGAATNQIATLRGLTSDNPTQQARLRVVEPLTALRVSRLEESMALRRTAGLAAAAEPLIAGAGPALMERLQTAIDEMASEELHLLSVRIGSAEGRLARAKFLLLLVTGTGIFLSVAEGIRITRAREQRGRRAIERKMMDDRLFAEKERAEVTLNSIGDAVACTDVLGRLTFLNRVAEAMTGWSNQEAEGHPITTVMPILTAANRAPIPNLTTMAIAGDRTIQLPGDCVLVRRDGQTVAIDDSVAPIHDREARVTGAVMVFRDVSDTRAMALEMSHAAHHDRLTGLPNRVLLQDRITQAVARARRQSHHVAVLFVDLDGFKHINDSLGHSVGDELLQSIAGRLLACVRTSDTVSRVGGDEFVVVLADVRHADDAIITATRMLHTVALAHTINQQDLHVTASIGVSIHPADGADAETLIKHADMAMYQAKSDGRRGYHCFEPAMQERAVDRQLLESSLRHALDRHEFALHYQPKINLHTRQITGVEALLRWRHPTRGLVSPAEFIPVAEDSGLMVPIGQWVLREACRQAQAWVAAGLPPITMAVNVSAVEFRAANFCDGVMAVLKRSEFNPRALELELTESMLMTHADLSASILKRLGNLGVQVAMDDFGTGYSSLSYLKKFPLDALKIDQSFVRQIVTTPDDTPLVTAVISLGRSLKLRVIAEGVETPDELAFLQAHQCEEAQGYLFSRPVPAGECARLLSAGLGAAHRPMPAPAPTPARARA